MYVRVTYLKWDNERKEAFLATCNTNSEGVLATPGLKSCQLIETSPGCGMMLVHYDSQESLAAADSRLAKLYEPLADFFVATPERQSGEVIGAWG